MKLLWNNLKSHRRAVLCAGVGVLCLIIFALVWVLKVRGNGEKSLSIKWNDAFEAVSPAVEESITQDFTFDQDILGLAVMFELEGEPQGKLDLTLSDAATGEVLAQSEGEMGNIISGQYTGLGVNPIISGEAGRTYRLTLTPHYETDGRLALRYSAAAPEGQLTADGQLLEGGLALILTYNRVGGFLTRFYWVVCLLLTLVICGVFFFAPRLVLRLHWAVFGLLLMFGLLYTAVLPPYASPDEQYHINQSFTVACRIANAVSGDEWKMGHVSPEVSYRRPSDQNGLIQDQETSVFTWKIFSEQLTRTTEDAFDAHQEFDEEQADSKNALYLFSGLTVFLCYVLHLGFVPTLLLGRLTNLILFALLVCWAIKKAPFGKQILSVVALLPMTLHLAASFSRDSLLLGVAFALVGGCLGAAFGRKETLTWKELLPLFLLACLLAPAKYVYLPMVALFFFIPAHRLGKRAKPIRIGYLVCIAAMLVLTSSLFYNAVSLMQGRVTKEAFSQSLMSTGVELTAPQETEDVQAPAEESSEVPEADTIRYSPMYILRHPVDTMLLAVNSVIENGDHYLRTLVGGSLSYYSVNLAWGWVLLLYGILAVACLSPVGMPQLPLIPRRIAGLAVLACAALTVAGCITWTPTYYTTIYGLQGRYFLPLLPALLYAISPAHLHPERDCTAGLLVASAVANAGILLNTMLVIIAR